MNHDAIRETLAELKLGPAQSFNNNHVIPIIGGPPSAIAYRSLADALRSKSLRITEVTDSGSVPNLAVINESDQPVLLIDGEEVAGAKQNRTLNTTILVPAHSKLTIPVSCTEAGRWGYRSREFSDSATLAARGIRLKKNRAVQYSLRHNGGHRANQREIWSSIADLHSDLGSSSPTSAMKDAFISARPRLDEARDAFPREENQRGLIFVRDGRVSGLDVVSRPDVYAALHEKLIFSFVIDVGRHKDAPRDDADPEALAWAFMAKIAEAEVTEHASVGAGTDIRFSSDTVFGSALVAESEVVHLNAFPTENDGDDDGKAEPRESYDRSSLHIIY